MQYDVNVDMDKIQNNVEVVEPTEGQQSNSITDDVGEDADKIYDILENM